MFIESQFSYCPLVWMFHDRNINMKINKIHERALRIVYQDDHCSFETLLEKDGSFTVHEKNIQLLAIELHKSRYNLSNEAMQGIFCDSVYKIPNLHKVPEFGVPRVNTAHNGDDMLYHLGPLIWQILPSECKILPFNKFKKNIKKWKPDKCPCRLCRPYIQG